MKELIKKSTITLKEALKNLEYTGKKCIVIVDGKRKLLGTLTDGDLRASILSGTDLNSSIKKIYNSKPTYLLERNFDENKVKKLFLSKRFDLIPVVIQ